MTERENDLIRLGKADIMVKINLIGILINIFMTISVPVFFKLGFLCSMLFLIGFVFNYYLIKGIKHKHKLDDKK